MGRTSEDGDNVERNSSYSPTALILLQDTCHPLQQPCVKQGDDEENDDNGDVEEIVTCVLPAEARATLFNENDDNRLHYDVDGHDNVIENVAQLVDDVPDCCSDYMAFHRPEFLYVHAIKPSPDAPLGLVFCKRKKCNGSFVVYVKSIVPDGLFGKTGLLKVGDRVLAVNNVECTGTFNSNDDEENDNLGSGLTSLADLVSIVKAAPSDISICVQNQNRCFEDGRSYYSNNNNNPNGVVLSSVQKPTRDTKLGISFRTNRGALNIVAVKDDGLFASSLVMPEHRCLFLNGLPCDNVGAQEAADRTADLDRVTLVTRARHDLATILSVSVAGYNESTTTAATTSSPLPLPRQILGLDLVRIRCKKKKNKKNKSKFSRHARFLRDSLTLRSSAASRAT